MVYYIYRSRFDSGLMCCESAFKLTFDMVVFWCFTKITRRWSTIHLYYARVNSNACKDVYFDTWPKDVEH